MQRPLSGLGLGLGDRLARVPHVHRFRLQSRSGNLAPICWSACSAAGPAPAKPGNWMVTFKRIMGFVLTTGRRFLLSFIPARPWFHRAGAARRRLRMLVGGSSSVSGSRARLRAWGVAVASVATRQLSFGWLDDVMAKQFDHHGTKAICRG